MRRIVVIAVVAVIGLAGVLLYKRNGSESAAAAATAGGGRGSVRPPMPVEFAPVTRGPVAERSTIVGTLIGAATVEAVPKVNGRLQQVNVRLGDPVRRGQAIAKVEDREIREQVNQAEAAFKVSDATIRQREADLKLAQTNLERNRSLLDRQLLPRQTYDDTDARHQAAVAQLDLARAQHAQSKARLDELRINLSNTVISSPVDGFIGKRYLDPGAAVSPNAPVVSVVDIRTVRMVVNVVEKEVKRLSNGMEAQVQVDAFPGEKFVGRVGRIAPVFDPQTRTAEMEIEVPNQGYRLKPGMYARVELTLDSRPNALTLPRAAIVELEGKSGVFVASGPAPASSATQAPGTAPALTARFVPVVLGIRDADVVEVTSGVTEGMRVITTGALALKDGDRIVASGSGGRRGGDAPPGGARQGGER
ncbi:MAG: efflux RND transporter periplasmic adaptor subunit [Acidobacteria bacterium]|nr:efflux RND transporter periplasmic adaptor subunit [Acidobacteriota bacterium]